MVKKLLALEGVKLLNKEKQQKISGGDFVFGIPCETDDDCCDNTAEGLSAGAVCNTAGLFFHGTPPNTCVPSGLI